MIQLYNRLKMKLRNLNRDIQVKVHMFVKNRQWATHDLHRSDRFLFLVRKNKLGWTIINNHDDTKIVLKKDYEQSIIRHQSM